MLVISDVFSTVVPACEAVACLDATSLICQFCQVLLRTIHCETSWARVALACWLTAFCIRYSEGCGLLLVGRVTIGTRVRLASLLTAIILSDRSGIWILQHIARLAKGFAICAFQSRTTGPRAAVTLNECRGIAPVFRARTKIGHMG